MKPLLRIFAKSLWPKEVLSSKPLSVPLGFKKPPTLHEQIAMMIRNEDYLRQLRTKDQETFEEAEDFDVGEDYDPSSPWEEEYEGSFEVEKQLEKERNRPKKSSFKDEKPAPKKPKKEEGTE